MSIHINHNILTQSSLVVKEPQKTYFVKDSQLGVQEISLETEDLFTLETFKSMMTTRFDLGLDFYVVAIKEHEKFFFFEAAKFVEYFVSKKEINPFTKSPVEDFEVFWIAKGDQEFEHFAMKEYIAEYPNYLQLVWNDHSRTINQRGNALNNMGVAYEQGSYVIEKDESLAKELYKKASEMGSFKASCNLGCVYLKDNEIEKSTEAYLKGLECEDCSIEHYLLCSNKLENGIGIDIDLSRSLNLDKKVAEMGNYFGLISVINHLEKNFNKPEEAKSWRSVLPENIRDKSIEAMLLCYSNLSYNHEKAFALPKELLNELSQSAQGLKV